MDKTVDGRHFFLSNVIEEMEMANRDGGSFPVVRCALLIAAVLIVYLFVNPMDRRQQVLEDILVETNLLSLCQPDKEGERHLGDLTFSSHPFTRSQDGSVTPSQNCPDWQVEVRVKEGILPLISAPVWSAAKEENLRKILKNLYEKCQEDETVLRAKLGLPPEKPTG